MTVEERGTKMETKDERTVTLGAKDWLVVLDALANDELLAGSLDRDRLAEAIREQAGVV